MKPIKSPSIWWADGKIIDFVMNAKLDPSKTRIWMDMGRAEGKEGLSFTRRFNSEFNKKYPGFKNYRYKEFPDAPHRDRDGGSKGGRERALGLFPSPFYAYGVFELIETRLCNYAVMPVIF